MGKRDRLTCFEKRDLLNRSAVSVETLLDWAKHFEEEGLIHDAVDFYIKAGAKEDLTRLIEKAREEGDLFLFRRLCSALGHEPSAQELISIAVQAEGRGKLAFAAEAYRQAGAEDQAERLTSGQAEQKLQ